MSYLLLFMYLIIICFIIYRSRFFSSDNLPKYVPIALYLLKFVAGLSVYLIYSKYYNNRHSSDIFKYFDDGMVIHSSIYENPMDYFRMITGIGSDSMHLYKYYDTCSFWIKQFNYGLFNDNLTVIRFNAIVRLISMGNIHIHTLIMSFISFVGLWSIFKVFENKFVKQKWLLTCIIFFLPSVYFWTSGILKEGILIFAFGILLYSFNSLLYKKFNVKLLLLLIIAISLLLVSKFYVLIAALPGLSLIIILKHTRIKYTWLKFIGVHLAFLAMAWLTKPLINLNFPEILANKQHDFIAYVNSLNHVGSKIEIAKIDPTLLSILKVSPKAFFNALFKPTIFEASNPMMLFAAIENLIILMSIIITVIFLSIKKIESPWLLFCISFTIILFVLSGITTPVLGALVRYKAPALPFLGIAMMYLIDFNKISNFMNKITSKNIKG